MPLRGKFPHTLCSEAGLPGSTGMDTPLQHAPPGDLTRRLLIGFALLLELTHLLVLCLLPHPALVSNVLQLLPPALVFVVGLRRRARSNNALARRHWTAVAAAFGLWLLAQAFFLYYMLIPARHPSLVRPDNVLWILSNLPLLLATIMTREEIDYVGWLDRMQVFLFFAVLYLLVFMPSIQFDIDNAFDIQDIALVLCFLSRLSICHSAGERRFFVRLLQFMLIYGTMDLGGILLERRGLLPRHGMDLVWTLPIAAFAVILLRDEHPAALGNEPPGRLLLAARSAQGFGVAILAFLSMAVSGLLAVHLPVLGGILVFGAFALFALRTNARERAWHLSHGSLEKTALHDTLTGLGNRMKLRGCLEEHLLDSPAGLGPVLVFVDLDRFKAINDSLGHALGDQLLIAVANRLRIAAPAGSVVCRHGGDEFILLALAAHAKQAEAIGATLLEALRPAYLLKGHQLHCTASIGVVLAAPGETADELLRTADHAMYRAKQLGKNCVQFFDAGLRKEMSHRWLMEAALRRQLEEGGLDVVFQPILTVEGGSISGFEALARWRHPVFGDVPPAEFIPLAEESGLILLLGAQILEKASRQVALWNSLWQTELSLSVNVSPRQFADAGLLKVVLEALERTHLPPRLLQLEITETALLANQDLAKQTLTAARTHGIRISLDDFGTGYSSLAFLLNLPVDEVKVDRSFVSEMRVDLQRKELVRAVVQLGQSLGKRVVAEGVETEEDLRELAAMGCECAQGWHIGRPMSAEATEAGLPAFASLARKGRLVWVEPGPWPTHALPLNREQHPVTATVEV